MKTDNSDPTSPILRPHHNDWQREKKSGHWTTLEHQQYLDFLHQTKELIESSNNNKGQRLFKKMSQIIGTRTPSQCRSHHQKFNPFNSQLNKRKKFKKRTRENIEPYIRSKTMIRKMFASLPKDPDED
ncbi:hypothetical protein pb186bvf_010787 [Paramecium bursaria]